MRGRPLAFLVFVTVGWSLGRFWTLLPDQIAGPLTLAFGDIAPLSAAAKAAPAPVSSSVHPVIAAHRRSAAPPPVSRRAMAGRSEPDPALATVVVAAIGPPYAATVTASSAVPHDLAPPGLPPTAMASSPSRRWSGSGWAIARDGGGASLLSPLLGGSQAGARVAYRLDDDGRVALFARAATPLRGGPAELAGGAQWRPTPAAVTLYAEVRAIGRRAAPAAGAFGGGAVALAAGFRLEGYGQAGVIRRDGVDAFGDAQLRVVRPLGRIEAGAGAWAAAQRGASRIDLGPSIALPIQADPVAFRVTLDWRHRVVGNARPASGPTLSLGADF